MTVAHSSWVQPATYDPLVGWTSNDAMIAKFLNASCVPDDAEDFDAALELVQAQFPGASVVEA